jgi:signal recognition particle subunit SEC65
MKIKSMSDLTLGELAKIEELGGKNISALEDSANPQIKMIIALMYVVEKRENPATTLMQIENKTLDDLKEFFTNFTKEDTEEKK